MAAFSLLPQHEYAENGSLYTLFTTADGSPTLSCRPALPHALVCSNTLAMGHSKNSGPEKMHNSAGAFNETLCIYQPVAQFVLSQPAPWSFLSVGLGIGYLELLTVALFVKFHPKMSSKLFAECLKISSSERDPVLQREFLAFVLGSNTQPFFAAAYKSLVEFFCVHFNISQLKLIHTLAELFYAGSWIFPGPLNSQENDLTNKESTNAGNIVLFNQETQKFNGIYFDAFSPATSPELWTSSFVSQLIEQSCEPCCAFASYASRTELKRILRTHGFEVHKTPGFAGKREATFATRQREVASP